MSQTLTVKRRLAVDLDRASIAELVGIVLDPWQSDALRDVVSNIILLCSRQSGKSTVAAFLAVLELLSDPAALVLLCGPTLRQAGELRRKTLDILTALGPVAPPIVQVSALSLELSTGARVVCLPGSETSARSWSNVSLFIVDEASRCSDDLYHALRPTIATSGGRIVLLSTPNGRRGFFFREWSEGGANWRRVRITAEQCPRITPAFLAEEKASLPAHVFASEYLCSFADIENVFGTAYIDAAFRDSIRPLWG